MPQSLAKVLLHVVFSTKDREKTIPQDLRLDLHAYLAGVCRAKGAEAYRVGGTSDHIHIACTLPRTLTMAKLIEEIKKPASIWIKQQASGIRDFLLRPISIARVAQVHRQPGRTPSNEELQRRAARVFGKVWCRI